MAEIVNWSFVVQVAGGPTNTDAGKLQVEAYGMIEVEVPDKNTAGGEATVDVQPSDTGVKLLLVKASKYEGLKYKVDDQAEQQTLDQPLLLIGEGAVKLLGATQKRFIFTNAGDEVVTVHILVGRKATVPPPS